MVLISWDESLSVNVQEIDNQHQKIVKMINKLHDAMRQGKGKDVLGKIINNLVKYTQIHFQTEEKYFAKFDYPNAETHKKEHQNFVKKVIEFREDFESGRLGLTIQVMNFLRDWLTNHIQGSDKKYSKFFNERGLT